MVFSKAEGMEEKEKACQSHMLEWASVPSVKKLDISQVI